MIRVLCLAYFLISAATLEAEIRTRVIVSDLHMDADFRFGAAFDAFIQNMLEISSGSTDLILNGDTFELGVCPLGCTETQVLEQLNEILLKQSGRFDALARFVNYGENRLVFVPGDSDAGLFFPAIANRLRERLSEQGGRVEIAEQGFWISRDAHILVEHGHQFATDAYRLQSWPQPFVGNGAQKRLARSWGEMIISSYLRGKEKDFPLVQDFAELVMGLKYALAINSVQGFGEELPRVLKFILLKVSWQQFRRNLEMEVSPPEWDLSLIREQGHRFLQESLPKDDPLYRAWQNNPIEITDFSDEELQAICDSRAAVRRARRRMERGLSQLARVGPLAPACPRSNETRGPSFQYFWSSRDNIYRARLKEVIKEQSVSTFIHGHTHLADRGFKIGVEGLGPRVFNSGAFKKVLTPATFELMKVNRQATSESLLNSLQLDDLDDCYSFILIEPYESQPDPRVLYWFPVDKGGFEFDRTCG